MGDTEQIDMKYKDRSVLSKLVNTFKTDPVVGVIEFGPDDCVRNEIIPHLLDKIKIIEEQELKEKSERLSKKYKKEE